MKPLFQLDYFLTSILLICCFGTFLREAGNGDFCFVEDAALAPVEKRIEKLIIFKWNRTYPADRYFDLKLHEGTWHLALSSNFTGYSHERITMEVFER